MNEGGGRVDSLVAFNAETSSGAWPALNAERHRIEAARREGEFSRGCAKGKRDAVGEERLAVNAGTLAVGETDQDLVVSAMVGW